MLIREVIVLKLEGRVIGDGDGDGEGIGGGDAAGHGGSGEGIGGGDAATAGCSWSGEKGFGSSVIVEVKVEEGCKEGCKKGEGGKEGGGGCNGERGLGSSVKETCFFLFPFFFSAAIAHVFGAICI